MRCLIRIVFLFIISGLTLSSVLGQKTNLGRSSEKAEVKNHPLADGDENVIERVKQLEELVRMMRAEIETLKKSASGNENKSKTLAKASPAEPDKGMANPSVRPPVESDKQKSEKDLGFEAGDYRITPYGIIFFNAFSNSGGTNNADDPLWATPSGASNASASGRQTRFGLRVDGGQLGNTNVKGVIEADFYGGLPAVGVGENMGVVRLRLAHVRLDWEKTSLLIGQDWMIFAPNSPTSLAAQAIPQFAAAGNPWSRLPQIRVDRKLGGKFLWQGAVLAPGTGDFPAGNNTPVLLQPGSGALSKTPFFQTRLAFTEPDWFGTGEAGTVGIAGHFGRSRISNVNTSQNLNSYGLAVDWKIPLFKRVSTVGELFTGANLGGFQAGIFQGYNADFGFAETSNQGATGGIRAIGTSGGWVQFGWNLPVLRDRLSMYGSVGIDDPRNADLKSVANRNFRSQNLGYAYDLIYVFSPQFSIGGEFRRLDTRYFLGNRESSNHLNFGAKYSF